MSPSSEEVAVKGENPKSEFDTAPLRIKCTLCSLKFENATKLTEHLLVYHRVDGNANDDGGVRSRVKKEPKSLHAKPGTVLPKREAKPRVTKVLKKIMDPCRICDVLLERKDIVPHLRTAHQQAFAPRRHSEPTYECSFCFDKLFTKFSLNWHFRERHEPWLWDEFVSEQSRKGALKKQPKCPQCGEERFSCWGAVQTHLVEFHDHEPREEFMEEQAVDTTQQAPDEAVVSDDDDDCNDVELLRVKRRTSRPESSGSGLETNEGTAVIDLLDSDDEEDGSSNSTTESRPISGASSDFPLLLDEDDDPKSETQDEVVEILPPPGNPVLPKSMSRSSNRDGDAGTDATDEDLVIIEEHGCSLSEDGRSSRGERRAVKRSPPNDGMQANVPAKISVVDHGSNANA